MFERLLDEVCELLHRSLFGEIQGKALDVSFGIGVGLSDLVDSFLVFRHAPAPD